MEENRSSSKGPSRRSSATVSRRQSVYDINTPREKRLSVHWKDFHEELRTAVGIVNALDVDEEEKRPVSSKDRAISAEVSVEHPSRSAEGSRGSRSRSRRPNLSQLNTSENVGSPMSSPLNTQGIETHMSSGGISVNANSAVNSAPISRKPMLTRQATDRELLDQQSIEAVNQKLVGILKLERARSESRLNISSTANSNGNANGANGRFRQFSEAAQRISPQDPSTVNGNDRFFGYSSGKEMVVKEEEEGMFPVSTDENTVDHDESDIVNVTTMDKTTDEMEGMMKYSAVDDSFDAYNWHVNHNADVAAEIAVLQEEIAAEKSFLRPTVSSILPPYLNSESERVRNSYRTGSYWSLKKLPEVIRAGNISRQRKHAAMRNLVGEKTSFRPASYTIKPNPDTLQSRVEEMLREKAAQDQLLKETDELLAGYKDALSQENERLKKQATTRYGGSESIAGGEEPGVVTSKLPLHINLLTALQEDITEQVADGHTPRNFRLDPMTRKAFVVPASNRGAMNDIFNNPLPTPVNQTKESEQSSSKLSKRRDDALSSTRPAAASTGGITTRFLPSGKRLETAPNKRFTKTSTADLRKCMQALYEQLARDWAAYPFRLKFTASQELLILFTAPTSKSEDNISNETGSPGRSVMNSGPAPGVPFPPPNDALRHYMRTLARHGLLRDFGFRRRGDRWHVLEEDDVFVPETTLEDDDDESLHSSVHGGDTDASLEALETANSNVAERFVPPPLKPMLSLSAMPLQLADDREELDRQRWYVGSAEDVRKSILASRSPTSNNEQNCEFEDVSSAVAHAMNALVGSNTTGSSEYSRSVVLGHRDIVRRSLTTVPQSPVPPSSNLPIMLDDSMPHLDPLKEDDINSTPSTLPAARVQKAHVLCFAFYAPWASTATIVNTSRQYAQKNRIAARKFGIKQEDLFSKKPEPVSETNEVSNSQRKGVDLPSIPRNTSLVRRSSLHAV